MIAAGILAAELGAGCAGNSPINVDKSAPPTTSAASPTPPSMTLFLSNVNPFITSATGTPCSNTSCHDSVTGSHDSGTPYILSATDGTANYMATSCSPRLTAYGSSPSGNFLAKFCTGSGAPIGAGHNGHIATAQNCTDFYDWAKSGIGTPPTCP